MMYAEIKKKWVEALRSGDYKQIHGSLRDGDGYCCLGVLTDLYCKDNHPKADVEEWWDDLEELGVLPEKVMKWSGLLSDNPELKTEDGSGGVRRDVASDLNDELRLDFKAIADAIQRTL